MSGVLERGDVVDVLYRDGRCLVLTSRHCLRLEEVATTALAFLDRPRTTESLEEHLVARFGTAPDGAVDELVRSLMQAGVVVLVP